MLLLQCLETGDNSIDRISHVSLSPATGLTTPESATYEQAIASPAESDASSQIVKGI